MNMYLIRSAEASPWGENGISLDDRRPLTPAGLERAKQLAVGLRSHKVLLNVVITSPLGRARETAVAMLGAWTPPPPLQPPQLLENDDLKPDGKYKRLTRFLRDHPLNSVALIGHGDFLSCYTGWLIGSQNADIQLAPAGVAHITFSVEPRKGTGALVWLVTPEWLGEKQAGEKQVSD